MSHLAPEPSPAPTLAGVPGYFPATPDSAHAADPFESTEESYAHKANNAVGVAVGAAAGLLLGGPLAGLVGASLVGAGELENDGLKAQLGDEPSRKATPASEPSPADQAPFETQEANAQAELEQSPAQKLVSPDADKAASDLPAASALLAGAAGAKFAENEVPEPEEEDHSRTPTTTRPALPQVDQEVATPPDFGTPAVEKEQAALAASPAQRLLGERSESTVGAENILLAGATGAHVANREVEEPITDAATGDKLTPTGSGANIDSAGTSEPLELLVVQVSSVPQPAPETPRPVINSQPSNTSFAAAVLAAGSGIDTPTREDVPLSMTGSTGVHPLVQASDQSMRDPVSQAPESQLDTAPHSRPNVLPAFFPVQPDVAAAPIEQNILEPSRDAGVAQNEEHIDPSSDGNVVLADLAPTTDTVQPQAEDFEPYTPPVVGEEPKEPVLDKGKEKEHEVAGLAAGGLAGGVLAHELREKRSIDSTDGRSSQPGSIFQENFTPPPQPIEYDPLAIENQRAIPPQQARGDPVLVLPSVDKGKGRAIEPEELQQVPSTTAEQAGFARGAPQTVATEEFAHLSQPAPQAELAQETEAPVRAEPVVATAPAAAKETKIAAAAFPAVAGAAGASAMPLAVNNNATSAQFSQAPHAMLAAQQPLPIPQSQPAAVVHQPIVHQPIGQHQQQAVQQAPVARAQAAPAQFENAAQPVSPARTASPHGLVDGIERSPHMHIQTNHDDAGHKKLHRKSLAADRVPLKFGVGATKSSKAIEQESRRDRVMDSLSGVPDPTLQRQQPVMAQAPQQFVAQPRQQPTAVHYQQQPQQGINQAQGVRAVPAAPSRVAAVGSQGALTPVPVGAAGQQPLPSAQTVRTSAPSSPSSPVGQGHAQVNRKLSKSRPRSKSNTSEKGSFFSKVFGSSKHSREGSGSVDGGSHRGSMEAQRPSA
ncbi:uncharacterized protein JCM15063_000702 [Sporobolomyces koalae]|uniref:uncharacterized protein n=1 Tax=Sporobolomyces koalae TaxID=500713 RepID=UPI003176D82A